ncbi:DUF2851 family protein [Bacteroidota bacterium]
MKEELLHFIWKYRLLYGNVLLTKEGEVIEITSPGVHNANAGPDFLDARIKIGDTIWAGSIEIHVQSSDWFRHKHQHEYI